MLILSRGRNTNGSKKLSARGPNWGQILITGMRRESAEFGRSDSDPN
jgi:hypothetical protein